MIQFTCSFRSSIPKSNYDPFQIRNKSKGPIKPAGHQKFFYFLYIVKNYVKL